MSVQKMILAVTLLASTSMLTVVAMPSFQDTPAVLINSADLLDGLNPLHNLTLGERISGDKLSGQYPVEIPASPWHILMLFRDFKVASGQRITQVQVTNLEQHPDTSYVVRVVGGPPAQNVGLLFASKINEGIHFMVSIYSK